MLSSHPSIYILLHIEFTFTVRFRSFPRNVYLVFPVKSTVMVKETRLNKKWIEIYPEFAYTKYKVQGAMFKFAILDLQQKNDQKNYGKS